jgi:hypothetical protein
MEREMDPVLVAGERRDQNRTEAEFRASRLPDEYWINVFRSTRTGDLNTDTNHLNKDDALEEIACGYPRLEYLHTIHVSATANRTIWNSGTFDLQDEADAWACEAARNAMAELKHITDERRDWEEQR